MAETTPNISLKTLNRIANIDEFKGRWESQGQLVANRLRALQRIANMESTAAISRMMGIRCSDRQIGEFLSSHDSKCHLSKEEGDVVNAFHLVLKLVNDSYEQIPFIESHIMQMHDLLINRGKPAEPVGDELQGKLSGLIGHVDKLIKENDLHPLMIIGDFSFRFWHMRPFHQGNNRLTWLLTQLLLLRHDYYFITYGSITHFLEKRLADYHRSLLFTKAGEIVNPDPQAWLNLFLDVMVDLQENIVTKINREKNLLRLSTPLREIITTIQEQGQATISQIMATTAMNRNTLKVRLRKLVAEEFLIQQGKGKATHYLLPELRHQ